LEGEPDLLEGEPDLVAGEPDLLAGEPDLLAGDLDLLPSASRSGSGAKAFVGLEVGDAIVGSNGGKG